MTGNSLPDLPLSGGRNVDNIRDGTTPAIALHSPGLIANPNEEFTYLVNHLGQWVLAIPLEARKYLEIGFRVYQSDNRDGMVEVTERTDGPNAQVGGHLDRAAHIPPQLRNVTTFVQRTFFQTHRYTGYGSDYGWTH